MTGLSKSRLASHLQCPRRLWLEIHRPDLAPPVSPAQQAVFASGHDVGDLARRLYDPLGAGRLIDGADGMAAALQATAAAIAADPEAPLFEATFERDGLLVRADVIARDPATGSPRLVEVKSSTGVKPEHVTDCAIQAWVLAASTMAPGTVALAHINNQFVYPGAGDYRGLLVEADLTPQLAEPMARVPGWLESARQGLGGPEPDVRTGSRCSSPYLCPFTSHCWPCTDYPLTSLPGLAGSRLDALVEQGFSDLRDLPPELIRGVDAQRVWRASRTGRPEVVRAALDGLRGLAYPRYYLDFETIAPAIPRWPGLRPYQPVPFQWSLHSEVAPGQLAHAAHLDLSGNLPARPVAEALLDAAGDRGPILMYSTYERTCLKTLATLCPDLGPALEALSARLVDLLPIVRRSYYHPAMQGSWSIKAVLPTIATDLSYDELEGIQDGNAAQRAYLEAIAPATSRARHDELRHQLLRYCAQDTLAMVRVAAFLAARA
jgi:hypothetical protein